MAARRWDDRRVAHRCAHDYISRAGLRGATESYSRGLTILTGAVPDRAPGSGHMAPTYLCRFPGSALRRPLRLRTLVSFAVMAGPRRRRGTRPSRAGRQGRAFPIAIAGTNPAMATKFRRCQCLSIRSPLARPTCAYPPSRAATRCRPMRARSGRDRRGAPVSRRDRNGRHRFRLLADEERDSIRCR